MDTKHNDQIQNRIDYIDIEAWNNFYIKHPQGGPWDTVDFSPDEHVVDFINYFDIKTGKVLDAGCADGRNSKYLLEQGLDVTGIDISEEVITRTQKRFPNGTFIVKNIAELDFNKEFDAVIDAGALHVNHPKVYRTVFENYYNALKENGKLFIRLFYHEKPEKIFGVRPSMPVYGLHDRDINKLIEGLFVVKNSEYDPMYGAHMSGCNFLHMEKI